MSPPPDPMGIRAGSRFVIARARSVRIDDESVLRVAGQIAGNQSEPTTRSWAADHLGEISLTDEQLANFVLVLDALNFYFWGEPRWKVTVQADTENGYRALAMALHRALGEGYPLTDARYLAEISALDVARILRGASVIPLFSSRVHNLREAGQSLLRDHQGRFLRCIEESDRSSTRLLEMIVRMFPSFVDVRVYDGRTVPFYKRAQILISDLAGAFQERDRRLFDDLSTLTAFADYKVPQVLHQLGVLRYTPRLEATLAAMATIPEGSPDEVEIRSATVVAIERIANALRAAGSPLPDYAVDWYLWELGQQDSADQLPYHRTPTIAY